MATVAASQAIAQIKTRLSDWRWRLDHLYYITDKKGAEVQFKMNWAQLELFKNMHYLNVILKARQLGFSTFILMFMLDVCVFNSNTSCGIIDATLDDSKVKLARIKWAWDRLPEWLRQANPIKTANAFSIEWENGSSISVGTSHRGGTLQYLHISEFGKICSKHPEKAREIVTGALNTVQAGQMVFIESTAEGQGGRFYDICQEAQALQRMKRKLTPLDYKFHFYPWWRAPEYQLFDPDVVVPDHMSKYFKKLKDKSGISLSAEQQAWYVKKYVTQQGDMKREFPATPEEAFEASVEGAIFGQWITRLEEHGKIGDFPPVEGVPVHTFWDIGRRDYNTIWFAQVLMRDEGPVIRVIHFYQNFMEGLPHYAKVCKELFDENGWEHGKDYFPHDIAVTEWGSGRSRIEQAQAAGFNAKKGVEMSLHDGINAVRATLPSCEFHEEGTSEGLALLRKYRWEWNDRLGVFRTGTPAHDDASHTADGFRTLGTTWRVIEPKAEKAPAAPTQINYHLDPETGLVAPNMNVRDIVEWKMRKKRMADM